MKNNLTIRQEKYTECSVLVENAHLMGNNIWNVVFGCAFVEVHIKDTEFLESIAAGEVNLSGGCSLICDILIEGVLETNAMHFGTVMHYITKVHGVKYKPDLQIAVCKEICETGA